MPNPDDFFDLLLTFRLAPLWGRHLWCFEWTVTASTGRIAMQFGTDTFVPFRMNCDSFGNPLTFHLDPSSGQNVFSSNDYCKG